MNWLSHKNKQSCADFPVDLEHFVTLLQCCFLDIPRLSPANNWDLMRCISESPVFCSKRVVLLYNFTSVIIWGNGGVVASKIPETTTDEGRFRSSNWSSGRNANCSWGRNLPNMVKKIEATDTWGIKQFYSGSMTYHVTMHNHKRIMVCNSVIPPSKSTTLG